MKGIVIFFSLKEKNRAKETIVDEKGAIYWCKYKSCFYIYV